MAILAMEPSELVVHLTAVEKIQSLHRDLRLPLSSVRRAVPVEDPWLAIRGWRMAGTSIRGVVGRGTFRHAHGYDFWLLRGDEPAVRIETASGRFAWVTVGVGPGGDPRAAADWVADAAGVARSG